MRKTIWNILEGDSSTSPSARTIDLAIVTLIVANVVAIILESIDSVYTGREAFFWWFEYFSVGIFTVEYLTRVIASASDPRYGKGIRGRLKYMATPMALLDLLAILPAYLIFLNVDLRMLRVLRVFRIFRALKLLRYTESLALLGVVMRKRRDELIMTTGLVFALLIITSTLMYYAEGKVQPEVYSSILDSMWWAIVTVTTVGYGDAYPVTPFGRVLAALMALIAVGFVAIPAGLLSSGFVEELRERKRRSSDDAGDYCPHCGKPLNKENG